MSARLRTGKRQGNLSVGVKALFPGGVGKHGEATLTTTNGEPQEVGFIVVSEWADYAICSVVTQVPPSSEVSRGTSPVLPSCSMVMVPFLSAGSQ